MRIARVGLYLLIAYQAFFLSVLLPGHTRGAITSDGRHTGDSCCCCTQSPGTTVPATPSHRDKEHCAICQFAVGLISVAAVDLSLPELELLEVLPNLRPTVTVSLDRISTCLACGPPVAAGTFHA